MVKVMFDRNEIPYNANILASKDDFGDAKTGAAMLATRTGVPIVPIYMPAEKRWFRWNQVVIGRPYYPEVSGKRATPEEYRTIAAEVMARIEALQPEAGR